MRYRTLDSAGDFVLGRGPNEYLVNSSQCVAQAVKTALLLHRGEWFLDLQKGIPYETEILGYGTASLYDAVIKNAILGVQGVASILSYSSVRNPTTRALTVAATINTIYGASSFSVFLSGYGVEPYSEFPYGGG
jgi:hypothetical protein